MSIQFHSLADVLQFDSLTSVIDALLPPLSLSLS
jgi:hypothetical protein